MFIAQLSLNIMLMCDAQYKMNQNSRYIFSYNKNVKYCMKFQKGFLNVKHEIGDMKVVPRFLKQFASKLDSLESRKKLIV